MVGSYPRPLWFTQQLAGRDVLEAFKVAAHAEARRLDPNVPTGVEQTYLMIGDLDRLLTIEQPRVIPGADDGILETTDRRLSTADNRGVLTQVVLLPLKARALKIGGPNYNCYVESDGDQSNGFTGVNLEGGDATKRYSTAQLGLWRTEVEPVETTSIARSTSASPIFMIEPLPNCFSICDRAAASAFALFSSIFGVSGPALEMTLSIGIIPSFGCWLRGPA